jgi:predicted  nucleic acid-binding Zn-ribbon protein
MDTAVSAEDMAQLETELAHLHDDLERFTGGGLLDCHAICDQRDAAVAERDRLRAKVERLRSDRDCEKRLRKDAEEFRENAIARAERYRLVSLKLDAELATERERVRVLREALENLRDEQNGAPLETRRDQWQLAMDDAREAIVATEGAK